MQTAFRLVEFTLQSLFGCPEPRFRVNANRLDPRKRSRVTRPTAHADKVGTAGQVLERIDDKCAVARKGRRYLLTKEVLHLDPQRIAQHVHVRHDDQVCRLYRFGKMIVFADFLRGVAVCGTDGSRWRAVRERALQGATDTRCQDVLRTGRCEIVLQ